MSDCLFPTVLYKWNQQHELFKTEKFYISGVQTASCWTFGIIILWKCIAHINDMPCSAHTIELFLFFFFPLSYSKAILSPTHACMLSLQSCLCDPMDYSPSGSSVHGILQGRILEWGAMPSSKGSSWSRDGRGTLASPALAGRLFTTSTDGEAHPTSHCP